jgi:hypothetical protein
MRAIKIHLTALLLLTSAALHMLLVHVGQDAFQTSALLTPLCVICLFDRVYLYKLWQIILLF